MIIFVHRYIAYYKRELYNIYVHKHIIYLQNSILTHLKNQKNRILKRLISILLSVSKKLCFDKKNILQKFDN